MVKTSTKSSSNSRKTILVKKDSSASSSVSRKSKEVSSKSSSKSSSKASTLTTTLSSNVLASQGNNRMYNSEFSATVFAVKEPKSKKAPGFIGVEVDSKKIWISYYNDGYSTDVFQWIKNKMQIGKTYIFRTFSPSDSSSPEYKLRQVCTDETHHKYSVTVTNKHNTRYITSKNEISFCAKIDGTSKVAYGSCSKEVFGQYFNYTDKTKSMNIWAQSMTDGSRTYLFDIVQIEWS